MEMSRAIPHLVRAGVRVVAIGLEPLGVEDFVAGGYWTGELYIDDGKKAYRALGLKSAGVVGAISQLFFNTKVRAELERTKDVSGNLSGDGMQLGATFVMDVGGAMILDFRQEDFSDFLSPEQLLEACGIPSRSLKPSRLRSSLAKSDSKEACGAACDVTPGST